jgi:hypothetical protein
VGPSRIDKPFEVSSWDIVILAPGLGLGGHDGMKVLAMIRDAEPKRLRHKGPN